MWLQIHYGVIQKDQTLASFLSIAYPYLGIIVAAFVFHAVRAPYLIDQERQLQIAQLARNQQEAADAKQYRKHEFVIGQLKELIVILGKSKRPYLPVDSRDQDSMKPEISETYRGTGKGSGDI